MDVSQLLPSGESMSCHPLPPSTFFHVHKDYSGCGVQKVAKSLEHIMDFPASKGRETPKSNTVTSAIG